MRWPRQLALIWLAGVLCTGALVAQANQRGTRRHLAPSSGCENATSAVPAPEADPLDDDAPGQAGAVRVSPHGSLEVSHLDPASPRPPLTARNRPAPRRLKIPAPSGDDTPAA